MTSRKLLPLPAGLEKFRTPPKDTAAPITEAFLPSMPGPLVVTILDSKYEREGRSTVVLTKRFEYVMPGTLRTIRIPRTYVTDFASIPWIVRGLIESFGRHARAAVIHDWLYVLHEGDRKEADKIAMLAMKDLGVAAWKRYAIYFAIRRFGGGGWDNAANEWKLTWANPDTGERIGEKYPQAAFHKGAWPPNDPDLG